MIRYTDITSPDINNGEGFRVTIWLSGCSHRCPGCHNRELWDYGIGKELTGDDMWRDIINRTWHSYIDGLTISGGDPLDRSDEDLEVLSEFIKKFKKIFPTKTVWIYTGFDKDSLTDIQLSVIMACDILVDGPYIESQKDLSLAFRGSSNQHIYTVDRELGTLCDITGTCDKKKTELIYKLDDNRIEI